MCRKNHYDKVIAGVCSGLAQCWNMDTMLVRAGFFFGALFTGSLLFWVYLFLALFMPSDKEN